MVDRSSERADRDHAYINVQEESELEYWTHHLGVSRAVLEAAVREVGVNVDAVRAYIAKHSYS